MWVTLCGILRWFLSNLINYWFLVGLSKIGTAKLSTPPLPIVLLLASRAKDTHEGFRFVVDIGNI